MPVSWLKLRSRVCRFRRDEKELGIGPVSRLLVREMTRRSTRFPRRGGMGPVTSPAKRTSWVRWVSLEMDAVREPASPGESERPVPSTREVTLREGEGSKSESEREQVTPAKVEQGRGEAKSHVEKK